MALAVVGHSPRGGLDLALQLECVKSMFGIVSSHRVHLLLSSLVIRELVARCNA